MPKKKKDQLVESAALLVRKGDLERQDLEQIWDAMNDTQRDQLGRSIRRWADGREALLSKMKAETELERSKTLAALLVAVILGDDEGEAVLKFLQSRTHRLKIPAESLELRTLLVGTLVRFWAEKKNQKADGQ